MNFLYIIIIVWWHIYHGIIGFVYDLTEIARSLQNPIQNPQKSFCGKVNFRYEFFKLHLTLQAIPSNLNLSI